MFDQNIVVDVNSGGVFVFDDLTYNMLDFIEVPMAKNCSELILKKFKNFEKAEVLQAYSQIYNLYINFIMTKEEIKEFIYQLEKARILNVIPISVV